MQHATASDARTREFVLTDAEFEELRRLVREHTGISLADSKRELVYGRLARRLRHLRLNSFREYLDLLERDVHSELEEFTNAITTNLTSFFREPHHFEFLANQVLGEIIQKNAKTKRLRIWSAGCSTGEEPYSIAITLMENMERLRGWDVKLLATDLDSQVLAHGQAGVYSEDRFDRMPNARRSRWFDAADKGKFRANEDLRSLITFKQLNLMHEWPMKGPFDVVFCRNVVIYFDKPTQKVLFDRMAQLQRVGDHLFIGHSESLFKVTDHYHLIGKTIYRMIR
jgi:chemotaxis protein methyltransferase CheR